MKTPPAIITTLGTLTIAAALSLTTALGQTKEIIQEKAKTTILTIFQIKDLLPADAIKQFSAASGIKVFYTPGPADKPIKTSLLKNIPAEEALKFVTGLAGLKFAYEKDGIRVVPVGTPL